MARGEVFYREVGAALKPDDVGITRDSRKRRLVHSRAADRQALNAPNDKLRVDFVLLAPYAFPGIVGIVRFLSIIGGCGEVIISGSKFNRGIWPDGSQKLVYR